MKKTTPRTPSPVTIDFETDGIEGRPTYPPKPVGVSIKYPGKPARYYAWGHHTGGNNCTIDDAISALHGALTNAQHNVGGALFQNAKFDIDVLETHFPELPKLEWHQIHDTLFLLYLHNPHARTFSLKPSAHEILGMAPEEQDAVKDWLTKNQPAPPDVIAKYTDKKKITETNFGAFISWCPGNIVAPYANGDVVRTEALFKHLYKSVCIDQDMLQAYNRERELMPILLHMERQGVPVNLKQLDSDVTMYSKWRNTIAAHVRKVLKTPDLNLDSADELIAALVAAKAVDESKLKMTPTGKLSTAKDSLTVAVKDPALTALLAYYSQISTCLDTFMIKWLGTAKKSKGLIFTTWNQTASTESGGKVGTKTGRLSSTPNFQNIPNVFIPLFKEFVDLTGLKGDELAKAKKLKASLPKLPKGFAGLPQLPLMRKYIVPFKGDVLIDRDYSQQEPRILGHYSGGKLQDAYNQNPWVDMHDSAKAELELMGLFYDRKPVKNTNLGLIYGMGVGLLAIKNSMTVEEAGALKKAILKLYPGLADMNREMKRRAAAGEPIRTWGGRVYYCEPGKIINGKFMTFEYKMLNVLIQGSAADCTKEAIIRYWKAKPTSHKLILQVHDQLVASVPKKEVVDGMHTLKNAMESVQFTVPMLSEGDVCKNNWCEKTVYDKKGVLK